MTDREALAKAEAERDSAQEHLAYHLRDFRPGADMEATGDLAVDMAAYAGRLQARLATFEALADEKHEPPIDLIHERCPAGGVGPGRECTACSAAGRAYLIGVEHVQRDLRAALRSDPDEASTDA